MAVILLVAGYGLLSRRAGQKPELAGPSSVVCRIGYQRNALYRHIFTAASKGFFEAEGVRVTLEPFVSANQMMEALLADRIDVTGLTNLEVALDVETHDPGRFVIGDMLVWRAYSFPDYLLVRSDLEVQSVQDLEGLTVGLHPGSAVRAFFKALMRMDGGDASKVHLMELRPELMQSALAAKRVDALYCMDPVATSVVAGGAGRVLVANPLSRLFPPPIPISGTAYSSTFIRHQPSTARAVLRAIERSIRYLREPGHDQEVAGYIARFTPVSPGLALRMHPSEYWTLDEVDSMRVQALANRFFELGVVRARHDAAQLLLPADFASRAQNSRR